MIDTIVLRFHGVLDKKDDTLSDVQDSNNQGSPYVVDEHHELYKKMLRYDKKFFNMVQRVNREKTSITLESDSEFLQAENGKKNIGFQHVKQVMRFVDDSVIRETIAATSGKWNSPSSIAAVVFKINHNAGYIDFNLSIPKYLYGHSLAEFIPQPSSKLYRKYGSFQFDSISFQRKFLYKRLLGFIEKFFTDMCQMFKLDTLPNKKYVEIRRIDLCFNQYFENKVDAINYLSHQKKIAKRKSTNANNRLDVHETSLEYFTTSGGYFKIYHKGTEYMSSKHGDYKKHTDYNRMRFEHHFKNNLIPEHLIPDKLDVDLFLKIKHDKLTGQPIYVDDKTKASINKTARILNKTDEFNTSFLKEEMDKVLRYEISLSGMFFSYQYKMHVFRNKPFKKRQPNGSFKEYNCCPVFKDLKDNYKYVHSVYNSVLKDDKLVTKFQHKDFKKVKDFLQRKICLTLSDNKNFEWLLKSSAYQYEKFGSNEIEMLPYKHTLLSTKDCGIFCDDFLQRGVDYFLKTIKGFQVQKLETYDTVSEKIKNYNKGVADRLKLYNAVNHYKTKDYYGEHKVKGNLIITKASQLLTQKEKRDLKLKRIDPLRLLQILREMERGLSLHQIRDKLEISKSTFSRLKSDLHMFGIYEQSLEMEKPIFTEISFRQYYHKTKGMNYQNNFYHKETHMRYG